MGEVRKQKQEQEPARDEVTEVAPNVLRMQLPISMPGLGHVNAYALVDDRGAAIVDPGMPGPESWNALEKRLKQAGLKVRDVHTVIVTHSHPDHFGGAGRLTEEAGAEMVTHSAFRSWFRPHDHSDDDDLEVVHDVHPDDLPPPRVMPPHGHGRGAHGGGGMGRRGGAPWGGPTPWGGRAEKPPLRQRMKFRVMMATRGRRMRGFMAPDPTNRLKNGDVIKLAGREWLALHTPGHTLDHLCLYDGEAGVLLSGDHVLPTITPHIGGMNSGRDPLGLFFGSLDKVAALDGVTKVLPAHGHPFDDLKARTDAIKDHHHDRLDVLRRVAADQGGSASVEEFSHHLFRPERWGSMAESETYAHLEHLRLSGQAERHEEDGVVIYEIAPATSTAG